MPRSGIDGPARRTGRAGRRANRAAYKAVLENQVARRVNFDAFLGLFLLRGRQMSEMEKKDLEMTGSEDVKAAEDAQADAAAEAEVVEGEAADFDPVDEVNRTIEAAKKELENVIKTAKSAFDDIRKQLAPIRDNINEIGDSLKKGVTEDAPQDGVDKKSALFDADETDQAADDDGLDEDENEDEIADSEAEDADDEDEAEDAEDKDEDEGAEDAEADAVPGREIDMAVVSAAAHEASDLLADGFQKLKSHASNIKFDFKSAISKEFEQYADENLKDSDYEVDENGKRVVKIDGKFVQEHASDVVPALIRGAVGSFFKAFLGTDIMADGSKEAADAPSEDAKAEAENADADSKYRVQFDFSNAVKDAIRNAKVTPAAQNEEEVKEREAGREVLMEGAHLVEDALNGKNTDDARDRLAAAYKHGALDESEKAPEEIQAVDEKHQKILDLAKQFENSVSSDHASEP